MTTRRPQLFTAALLIAFLLPAASAYGGLSFGVGINPLDLVGNANVTLPLFETGEAQHAARADVSYAFSGLPAVSASYLLRDAQPERVQTYFGAGVGLAFLSAPSTSPVLSLHALAGANVRIAGSFGAFTEVVVGGNALASRMGFTLGLNVTLGGN